MGRNRIKIEPIASERTRLATFNKRKMGLIKKAMELSILCDCEVALMVVSNNKLTSYATANLDDIISRYSQGKFDKPLPTPLTNADYTGLFEKKSKPPPTKRQRCEPSKPSNKKASGKTGSSMSVFQPFPSMAGGPPFSLPFQHPSMVPAKNGSVALFRAPPAALPTPLLQSMLAFGAKSPQDAGTQSSPSMDTDSSISSGSSFGGSSSVLSLPEIELPFSLPNSSSTSPSTSSNSSTTNGSTKKATGAKKKNSSSEKRKRYTKKVNKKQLSLTIPNNNSFAPPAPVNGQSAASASSSTASNSASNSSSHSSSSLLSSSSMPGGGFSIPRFIPPGSNSSSSGGNASTSSSSSSSTTSSTSPSSSSTSSSSASSSSSLLAIPPFPAAFTGFTPGGQQSSKLFSMPTPNFMAFQMPQANFSAMSVSGTESPSFFSESLPELPTPTPAVTTPTSFWSQSWLQSPKTPPSHITLNSPSSGEPTTPQLDVSRPFPGEKKKESVLEV